MFSFVYSQASKNYIPSILATNVCTPKLFIRHIYMLAISQIVKVTTCVVHTSNIRTYIRKLQRISMHIHTQCQPHNYVTDGISTI